MVVNGTAVGSEADPGLIDDELKAALCEVIVGGQMQRQAKADERREKCNPVRPAVPAEAA
jgi:hypothetical protein